MKRINDRIANRRNRTPGKQISTDALGSAVGGGCCIQGCQNCDSPKLKPFKPIKPIGPLGGL